MPSHELNYIQQLFLQMPYNLLMDSLIDASRKIIDELDFDKLIESQVKRQKVIAEMQIRYLSKSKVNG